MPSQKIVWTVLPKGIQGSTLKLSVYMSPRLTPGGASGVLGSFPDFWNPAKDHWPGTALARGFQLEFLIGGSPKPVGTKIDGSGPDAKVWAALFKATTPVKPFQYQDLSTRFIHSYPVQTVVGFLKDLYKGVAETAPTSFPHIRPHKDDSPVPTLQGLTSVVGKVATNPAWLRVPWNPANLIKDQKRRVLDPNKYQQYGFGSKEELAFAEVNRFYKRPRKGNPYRETPDPALVGVAKRLTVPKPDFHEMLASLSDYPTLMRMLGVVIDLEVVIPAGESIGTYLGADAVRVRQLGTSEYTPWTRITKEFVAAPRGGSDITNGMLRLDSGDLFEVVQVDVDALGLKALQFAGAMVGVNNAQVGSEPGVNYTMSEDQALPSIRTSGIAVARNGRAQRIADQLAASSSLNAALTSGTPADLYADDLVRGYRIDVHDKAAGEWRSLCDRKSHYEFTEGTHSPLDITDEGYVKGASSTSTNDGIPTDQELYLHETMFQWDGWSLTASRPGRTIVPETYDAGGAPMVHQEEKVERPANKAVTDLKLEVMHAPRPGSLPRLRYGHEYLVRARVVDLAGNSVPLKPPASWDKAEPSWVALPPNDHPTKPVLYGRFEPVSSPAIVPRTAFTEGEALERMVIRSNGGIDPAAYIEQEYVKKAIEGKWYAYAVVNERHVAPPKTSQFAAELHSRFEDWIGSGKSHGDAFNVGVKEAGTFLDMKVVDTSTGNATIDVVGIKLITPDGVPKPRAVLPGTPVGADQYALKPGERLAAGQYVVHDTDTLLLPYLPDPFARGTALRGLPKVTSSGSIAGGLDKVSFSSNPADVALKIPFDGTWPDAKPFRIQLVEGTGDPEWKSSERLLVVPMPKGRKATVFYSSYIGKDPKTGQPDFQLMGLSQWASNPASTLAPFAEAGGHWMLTPFRTLELVHAVQQPLKKPTFSKSQVRKWAIGDTWVDMYGFIDIDAPSTGKLEALAQWFDPVDVVTADEPDDDPGTDEAPRFNHRGTVFTENVDEDAPDLFVIHCSDCDGLSGMKQKDLKGFKGVQLPAVQDGTSSKLGMDLKPVTDKVVADGGKMPVAIDAGKLKVAKGFTAVKDLPVADTGLVLPEYAPHCRHEFHDTKHRFVDYRTIGTTRYREYFPEAIVRDPKNITVEGPTWSRVNILSSARPDAPKILYVVPTFGWEEKKIGDQIVRRRCGNAVRVYLDRPWYSSGIGELLGVVLRQNSGPAMMVPASEAKDPLKPYTTGVGMDAIWGSEFTKASLGINDFPLATHGQSDLTLDELSGVKVAVAGHPVDYDKVRKLWYCDIEIDAGPSYYPFVRLALARYQPDSIPDAHLSRVVQTDFAQLAPDRVAAVVFDDKDEKKLHVLVSGVYGTSHLFDSMAPDFDPSKYLLGSSSDPTVLAQQGSSRVLQVAVETKLPGSAPDAPWVPVTPPPGASASVVLTPVQKVDSKMIWAGDITLPEPPRKPGGRPYRLLITEAEVLAIDGQKINMGAGQMLPRSMRLVYADVIEI